MQELLKHDLFGIEDHLSYFRRMASQALLTRTVRSGSVTTLPPSSASGHPGISGTQGSGKEIMGYYSVIILTRIPKPGIRYGYKPDTVYFGESENMAKVSFYDAVRQARSMPDAEIVVVWHDLEELIKVYIEHDH